LTEKDKNDDVIEYVIVRYITKNGKRIYPKNGKYFKFPKRKK
jgi:hypothetical protein